MGNSISGINYDIKFNDDLNIFIIGDFLDCVSLAAELALFENVPSYREVKVQTDDEAFEVIVNSKECIIESLSNDEKNSIVMFTRYRDDTQSVICGDDFGVIIGIITKLCTMYPSHIGLTVEISHWYGSHLDA